MGTWVCVGWGWGVSTAISSSPKLPQVFLFNNSTTRSSFYEQVGNEMEPSWISFIFIGNIYISIFIGNIYISIFIGDIYISIFIGNIYISIFIGNIYIDIYIDIYRIFILIFIANIYISIFIGNKGELSNCFSINLQISNIKKNNFTFFIKNCKYTFENASSNCCREMSGF